MAVPSSKDLIKWLKPEPAPEEEIKWANDLKAGEYEIYNERLNNICYEAAQVLIRIGVSDMLRSGDLAVALYTAEGDLVTSHLGTYLHSSTSQLPIKFAMKNWLNNESVGIKEGDIFYANEALYGGIHNCDQIAFLPVFFKDELIAWTAAAVHQPETGSGDPGGMCPTAKTRYDEGMKIPPMRIGENHKIPDDMLEMMSNMVGRAPRMQVTDVRARAAGADRARTRIIEIAEEKGKEFVVGLFRKMLMESEMGARAKISKWNDGKYRCVVFSDCTGPIANLTRIFLTLIVKGDRLTFDFTGTSPENYSSWHALAHIVAAHTTVYIYGYAFNDLPISAGTYAPIDFLVPEGCVLNASPSAAISNSPTICNTVMVACPNVFSKVMFDSAERNLVAGANGCSGGGPPIIAGLNQYGVPFADMVSWVMNTFGQGARLDMDGMNSYGFAWAITGRAMDAEDTENNVPLLMIIEKHRKDSCGFGKYRGGSGPEMTFTPHHVPYVGYTAISTGGSKIFVGQGLFGGYPPPCAPAIHISGSDLMEKMERGDKDLPSTVSELVTKRAIKGDYKFMHHMIAPFPAMKGDVLWIGDGGGAGYGDVLERDPDLVIKDLKDEIITHKTARDLYCVFYIHETMAVDYEKTAELRQQERQKRLQRSKSYEEFEKDWLQKKPPEEILTVYGSWPDAKLVQPIMRI